MNEQMVSESEDVPAEAHRWRAAGKQVALATAVTTWGPSPRPAGSQLAGDADGAMVGSMVDAVLDSGAGE